MGFLGSGPDCGFCRMMRSMAFSGLGAALGAGAGYLLELERTDMWMCALAGAAIMVFLVMRKLDQNRE
jgi:hypothetical protein